MRRRLALATALVAALASATSASSALRPLAWKRFDVPRVRHGTLSIPAEHARGRVRVIVRLDLPPLAAAYGRDLAGRDTPRRLNVRSSSARSYLARLARRQSATAAAVRRTVPGARISRRFQILVDGLTVELPARGLPALAALPFVTRIYPSLRYSRLLDESPTLVGAPTLWAGGVRGEGVKIGVVDDGVDERHVFLNPTGMSYPPGFPKGAPRWTTPKVIVARAFPGPGSGRAGRLPIDRQASFHGTHVAGIAAGRAGTVSPGGRDHPATIGLSGVAPNAWVGNYRVFNVPSRIGNVANSPEIVAAFEAAVRDGMDVINFSGGSAETDPVNDVLIEATQNVAAAGVVPVIAAGNSRDEFGLGTVGSPGTAPAAISVAAVSNVHVFGSSLSIQDARAPATLRGVPFKASRTPAVRPWETRDQTLADVGSIVGTDGRPVDRRLCGVAHPNAPDTTLPSRSLTGAIALVFRGGCALFTKSERARAAGAIGLVLVNNRSGEADRLPIELSVPAGMVSDLDGARLRDFLGSVGGRALVRFSFDPQKVETGRGGIVTNFSSAGPTAFGHALKPDVAAPGGEILSSTLPEFAGAPFAVFDGTSMATPHVAGAVALLVQRHPAWTPAQIRSALVSTAAPAWADTARTTEASVLLEGGGLASAPGADDPTIFTDPPSLSFGDLNVNGGAARRSLLLGLSDAGGGSGTWTVEVRAQSASGGASVEASTVVTLAPGGRAQVPVTASASAQAAAGDDYGFLVLRRGATTRRVPYAFFVTRPGLQGLELAPLKRSQLGDTLGPSRVAAYRWPAAPFGHPPTYGDVPMVEDGTERAYLVPHLDRPVINLGVSIISSSRNAAIDPWFLGSLDENDVQGQAGTPVNVNALMFDYRLPVGAAGAVFPRLKRYYVAVDSGRDLLTGRSLAGRYLLRYWVNDLRPPSVRMLTTRVAAGRPTLAVSARDTGAGVDPYSLVLAYDRTLVGAAAWDPASGIAVIPLPRGARALRRGSTATILSVSDYQETKNVNTFGRNLMPNTRFRATRLRVVRGTTVTWLTPRQRGRCVRGNVSLLVVASSTGRIGGMRFLDGSRTITVDRTGIAGLYSATWRAGKAHAGRHRLRAVALTRRGRHASAARAVRVCR